MQNAVEKPEAKVLGVHPKLKENILLAVGRYGPYVKCGKNNYRIPNGLKGKELTFEDAQKIIDSASVK